MSGHYWHQEYDPVARSYVIVMPDSDGRRFRAGDRLLCWRSYYGSWFSAVIRDIGDCVRLDVEYPTGVYVEILPASAFVLEVKNGLYKIDDFCYHDFVDCPSVSPGK